MVATTTILVIITLAFLSLQGDSILLFLNIIIAIIDIAKQIIYIYRNVHQIIKLIIINLIQFIIRIYLFSLLYYVLLQLWPNNNQHQMVVYRRRH